MNIYPFLFAFQEFPKANPSYILTNRITYLPPVLNKGYKSFTPINQVINLYQEYL